MKGIELDKFAAEEMEQEKDYLNNSGNYSSAVPTEEQEERKSSISILQQNWKSFSSVPSNLQNKNPLQWNVDEVGQWLLALNFDLEDRQGFQEQRIDGASLFDIEESDLLSSGLLQKLGPRKKFIRSRNCLSCAYGIEPAPLPFLQELKEKREMKKEKNEIKHKEMKVFRKFLFHCSKVFIDDDYDKSEDFEDFDSVTQEESNKKHINNDIREKEKFDRMRAKTNQSIPSRGSKKEFRGNLVEFQKKAFANMTKGGASLFILFEMIINKIFPFHYFTYTIPAFFHLAAFMPGMFSVGMVSLTAQKI